MAVNIHTGSKVLVHYTGMFAHGEIFDSTRESDPLAFTQGQGTLLHDFENAVEGHTAGDLVRVTIPADRAYGAYDPTMVFSVARAQVPAHVPLEIGTCLRLSNGKINMDVRITEIGSDEITLDANHPMAGKDLTFEIEIVAVD